MAPVIPLQREPRPLRRAFTSGNARVLKPARERITRVSLPLFNSPRCQAGFPSPAADYIEDRIDLNELLIRNPPATFCVRSQGDSLIDIGLLDGDIVTVDRSLDPRPGKIVVAAYDGSIYIKRLRKIGNRMALCSENQKREAEYPPLFLDQAQEHTIWGVVTGVVRVL